MRLNNRFNNIPAFGLPIYMALMLIPLAELRFFEYQSTYSAPRLFQIGSVFFFILLSVYSVFLKSKSYRRIEFTSSIPLILLFIYILASSSISINPLQSFIYAIVTVIFISGCFYFWLVNQKTVYLSFGLAALSVIISLVYLAFELPIRERTLGWISPNLIGHLGFFLIVCSAFNKPKILLPIAVIGIILIIFSESRTVFVSSIIFLATFLIISNVIKNFKQAALLVITFILLAPIFLMLASSIVEIGTEVSTALLGVDDASRTSGTGLSGRSTYWANATQVISERPLFGYGFRTRETLALSAGPSVNAHSGLLNLLLDLGVIGGLLYFYVYVSSIIRSLVIFYQNRSYQSIHRTTSVVSISFLVSYVPILLVEPNYMNLSHPTSMLLLLFISYSLLTNRSN